MEYSFSAHRPVLNLGVWMPADYHEPPPGIQMVGRFSAGRFGWFVPKKLITSNGSTPIIPYTLFKNNNNSEFNRFIYNENIIKDL